MVKVTRPRKGTVLNLKAGEWRAAADDRKTAPIEDKRDELSIIVDVCGVDTVPYRRGSWLFVRGFDAETNAVRSIMVVATALP